MEEVKANDKVKVHYTGKLDDGDVFDTSKDREPLEFTVGEGKLIKGFEDAVLGMEVGQTKSIKIPSDDAYGPVNKELIQTVEKNKLPQDLNPSVGQTLVSKTPDGNSFNVLVTEVTDENITIDANHPLAGKNLSFDITLVEKA